MTRGHDRAVRTNALIDAACAVCPACGGREIGWLPVEGPNEAGNYVHTMDPARDGARTTTKLLCYATAVWALMRAEGREAGVQA